jgi:DNA repair protein RadD
MQQLQQDLLATAAAPRVLKPFQDQLDLIRDIGIVWKSLAEGRRKIIVKAATGFGKTVTFVLMIKNIREKNPRARICIVIDRKDLAGQTWARLVEWGVPEEWLSIMRGEDKRYYAERPVQIVSHQTVKARDFWPEAEFFIVDECHMQAKTVFAHMASEAGCKATWFGFSATPWSCGLGKHWHALVKGPSLAELVAAGRLSPWRIYAPENARIDTAGLAINRLKDDYAEKELEKRCIKLVSSTLKVWLELGQGRPTIVFASGKIHAQGLQQEFQKSGIATGYIDKDTPVAERVAIGKKLQAGDLQVVVNIQTLTTGLDWPFVSCIVLARPTKSEMLYVQMMGRGLRVSPETGKTDCIIIDQSTTSLDMGCLTQIDRDGLDDGAEKNATSARKEHEKAPPKLKECCNRVIKCAALSPSHERECVGCGAPFPIRTVVEVVEGSLIEISGTAPRGKHKPKTITEQVKAMGKGHVYAQLIQLGIDKGKSHLDAVKYAKALYRKLFNDWPGGLPQSRTERPAPALIEFARNSARAHYMSQQARREAVPAQSWKPTEADVISFMAAKAARDGGSTDAE